MEEVVVKQGEEVVNVEAVTKILKICQPPSLNLYSS